MMICEHWDGRTDCKLFGQAALAGRRVIRLSHHRLGPTQQRKANMSDLNPLNLFELDSRLQKILSLLKSGEPSATVAAAVDRFVADYSPEEHWGPYSLFSDKCREQWKRDGNYSWGNKIGAVEELDKSRGGERDRLIAVCEESLRFLLDSKCPEDWHKYGENLKEALRCYLSVRGHGIDALPTGKTELDETKANKQEKPNTLGNLLDDLGNAEWHYNYANDLSRKAQTEGTPYQSSLAAYHVIISSQYRGDGDRQWKALINRQGVNQVKTICIAYEGDFSSEILRKLCAVAALNVGKTLDDFLSIDVVNGVKLLQGAMAISATSKTVSLGHQRQSEGNGGKEDDSTGTPDIEQHLERVALAVGDKTAASILAIANRKDLSGERKMQEILKLDPRYSGKNSKAWGTLLGVNSAAVRSYQTWTTLQEEKKKAD